MIERSQTRETNIMFPKPNELNTHLIPRQRRISESRHEELNLFISLIGFRPPPRRLR